MSEHPELERIAAAVHADWVEGKQVHGITSRCGPDGEEYMVPYAQLSEAAKELDRATVRAVLKHLPAAALAPAPAASSGAEAGAALPADLAPMLTAVIEAGAAEWQCTEAMTAEQHGEEFARMVRETAERYGLGDEPRALHWLGVAGDRSLAFVGTSPHSPHLARALTGAWNQLVDNAPDLLASLAPAPAGAE